MKSLFFHPVVPIPKNASIWVPLIVIFFYFAVTLLTGFGCVAQPWDLSIGKSYQPPSLTHYKLWLGADFLGRSVLFKLLHGTEVAMSVGSVVCAFTLLIGSTLGALAGYFGGWCDRLVTWVYTVFSSVPQIMLLIAMTFVFGRSFIALSFILGITSWVNLARIVRGEFMKHRQRDYVLAAKSIGVSDGGLIFKHILPNIAPYLINSVAVEFMSAIKAEVILSFLGLGIQGKPSWGMMIDDAKLELAQGVWWQFVSATAALFLIILSFHTLGEAVQKVESK